MLCLALGFCEVHATPDSWDNLSKHCTIGTVLPLPGFGLILFSIDWQIYYQYSSQSGEDSNEGVYQALNKVIGNFKKENSDHGNGLPNKGILGQV